MRMHREKLMAGCAAAVAIALLSGCNNTAKEVVKTDYKVALNQYYQGWPRCIWPESIAMPIETSDVAEKAQLEALVSLGLMKHVGPAPAKGRKGPAKATYDITPAGKEAWMPDVLSPGAGNFCYGHPEILTVDRSRRNTASTDIVDFHYDIKNPPAWSKTPIAEAAIPEIQADLNGPHAAEAVLVDTTDGYRVQGSPKTIDPVTGPPKPEKRHLIRKMFNRFRHKTQ